MDGRSSNNETAHIKLNFVPLEINLKYTLTVEHFTVAPVFSYLVDCYTYFVDSSVGIGCRNILPQYQKQKTA